MIRILCLFMVLLMTSYSFGAYCELKSGSKGTIEIIDTASVYSSMEKTIVVKIKGKKTTLLKSKIQTLVINTDTIFYEDNRALRPDNSEYVVDFTTTERFTIAELNDKIENSTSFRTFGTSLVFIGAGFTTFGVFLMLKPNIESGSDLQGNSTSPDMSLPFGRLMVIPGLSIGLTGAVLAGIGNARINDYKRRIARLSIHSSIYKNGGGVSFVYRF